MGEQSLNTLQREAHGVRVETNQGDQQVEEHRQEEKYFVKIHKLCLTSESALLPMYVNTYKKFDSFFLLLSTYRKRQKNRCMYLTGQLMVDVLKKTNIFFIN